MAWIQTRCSSLPYIWMYCTCEDLGKHLAKLDDRSTPMVFVDYAAGTKGYRLYNPVTQRVHVSRDVVFEEDHGRDWGVEQGAGPDDDLESFHVEYITTVRAQGHDNEEEEAHVPEAGEASPEQRSPASAEAQPRTPTTPLPSQVEFVSPPSGSPDLDIDHDDAPLRFCAIMKFLAQGRHPSRRFESCDKSSCWQLAKSRQVRKKL